MKYIFTFNPKYPTVEDFVGRSEAKTNLQALKKLKGRLPDLFFSDKFFKIYEVYPVRKWESHYKGETHHVVYNSKFEEI